MGDYILGIKELDEAIDNIHKGSNILMLGPPMSGKDIILYNIMYHGAIANENAIINVSTRESGFHILEWFKENNLNLPLDRIGIIDCISRTTGIDVKENENIKIATSPVDLTGIGVNIGQFFEKFLHQKKIQKVQLQLNSLSTILMYSNIQTVFRFIHVFTGRIKTSGALGIYVMEKGMHEDQAIATLKQLFDGMIEIKTENEKNFIRMVGLSRKPTPWFEYEIDRSNLRILGKAP